ncbi:hypothetical protein MOD48_04695 [Bacillus spizizenii]|nr:hypothetical protein [Bacillus spizizenii]MCY8628798.1 hypothetical protein [Bacillus spizizenii]MCY8690680.1 hypothetical protein [Bacillus spizizenii]
MKQQLTIQQKKQGNIVDYKTVGQKKGGGRRAIQVNHELLKDQGLDFSNNSF